MENISAKTVFGYIMRMIRPFPLSIASMLLVAIFWAIDVSLRPYLLKIILDTIVNTPKADLLVAAGAPIFWYLFMSFMMSTVFRLHDYFASYKMIPEMRHTIALTAVQNLLGQSHQFYQNNYTGSLVNKVNDLTASIPDIIQIVTDRFIPLFCVILIAIFTLWQVAPIFSICMMTWASMFIIGALLLSNYMSKLSDDWSERGSIITGKMVDVLSNMLAVRLFSRQKNEISILSQAFDEAVNSEKKMQLVNFWVWFVYGYSFFLSLGFNFYFLIQGHQEGWITVGDFVIVLTINMSIVEFMWQVTRDFPNFTRLFGKITQGLRAILTEANVCNAPSARPLVIRAGEIKFEDVRFNYSDADSLFEGKSVTIQAKEKVGLVGYSGGGKTTFVNLILRLYDLNAGRITIDEQDISQVTQESLRDAISMIPQDPSLFNRSLMENIRYGCFSATNENVIEAAKKAYAHDFIMNIPQDYEAHIGERGVKLSGGQRQRLVIARAILKNAPILILDEATSQLDSITEGYIQSSINELIRNKTTIIIAHRLSTLLHMDRILVFDNGKIVESGPHQELIAKQGLYKSLWEKQVDGFLPE